MQEKNQRRSNEARSAEMRARLLTAARRLFVEKGFAETSTPEIVKSAEVTRGALYHHFSDKTAVFRAVVEAEAVAVGAEIAEGARASTDPVSALREGAAAYFVAMSRPGRARLMLLDGPSILGTVEMTEIVGGAGAAELKAGLIAACGPDLPHDQLTEMISAAFDRAALSIAQGAKPGPYLAALTTLLEALATRHT